MKRVQRAAHRRVWWVLGPFLLLVVVYGVLFPAVTPPADVPDHFFEGAP